MVDRAVAGVEHGECVGAGVAAHLQEAGDLVDGVGGVVNVDVVGVVAGVDLHRARGRLHVDRVEARAGVEHGLAGVRRRDAELVITGAERDVERL